MALEPAEIRCRPEICAVIRGIKMFGSPWQLVVIAYLLDRPLRFNELLRIGKDDGLNARTLSRTLKSLVENRLIEREIINSQPIGVQYSLTRGGKKLTRLLDTYRELDQEGVLRRPTPIVAQPSPHRA